MLKEAIYFYAAFTLNGFDDQEQT